MDGFCKACLVKYEDPSELLLYTEKNRRLFVYSTGLQVKQNDLIPFQLCHTCFVKMKMACQFKKQCRTSDKRLNHFLSLKEAGEDTDFCTYLQNNDGSVLFKFSHNGHSTPSFQKRKEDDNVSTSTSIRNFMTDFLREDEVPDNEAHIIREMIEREADVLDDSLDSQWLQEDISIASDFRFSPYSTPMSKYNYQPLLNYSPVKQEGEQKNCKINVLAAKKLILSSKSWSTSQPDSPISKKSETDQCLESSNKSEKITNQDTYIAAKRILLNPKLSACENQVDSINKPEENFDQDSYIAKKRMLLNAKSKRNDVNSEKDMETYLAAKSILDTKSNSSENEIQNIGKSLRDIPIKCKLMDEDEQIANKGFDVQIEETNTIQIADIGDVDGKSDIIDKNLEKLLNNTDDEVISLRALLASPSSGSVPQRNDIIATPSVHQGLSGANTPSIANILFGENLDDDKQGSKEKELDQANEDIVCDKDDKSDILEGFFDKKTGKYIGESEQYQEEIFEEYMNHNRDLSMPGKMIYDLTDFSCKKCNIQHKSEKGLKIHLAKKHNIKLVRIRKREGRAEIPCDICGKVFGLRSNLNKHIKVIHVNPKTKQVCKVCKLEFASEARLKLHMNIHNGVKNKIKKETKDNFNLMCNICGHVSSHPWNLKTHVARHNKSYKCTCDHCGAGFYRKSDLEVHMRIHMNVKPFKCSQCSKRFVRKDQLQIHLKFHKGERPYPCKICGKTFTTSTQLKNHTNTSKKCQNMKMEADLKENKAIEESIEQLYVSETLVTLGNDKIKEIYENKLDIKTETLKPADDVTLEDITMEDLLETNDKSIVQDDDKMSLSDMFTIPVILKDKSEL